MNKNIFFLLIVLLFSSAAIKAQNEDSQWVIGISGTLNVYGNSDTEAYNHPLGERYSVQFPKINVSRYLFKGITLDGSITLSAIDEIEGLFSDAFSYFAVDLVARYDFNTSDENLVPYIGIGAGIIGAPRSISGSKMTGSLQILGGGTFWFSESFGLNGQMGFKRSPQKIISILSHVEISFGLVYSFKKRVLNYRIWDRKY